MIRAMVVQTTQLRGSEVELSQTVFSLETDTPYTPDVADDLARRVVAMVDTYDQSALDEDDSR